MYSLFTLWPLIVMHGFSAGYDIVALEKMHCAKKINLIPSKLYIFFPISIFMWNWWPSWKCQQNCHLGSFLSYIFDSAQHFATMCLFPVSEEKSPYLTPNPNHILRDQRIHKYLTIAKKRVSLLSFWYSWSNKITLLSLINSKKRLSFFTPHCILYWMYYFVFQGVSSLQMLCCHWRTF